MRGKKSQQKNTIPPNVIAVIDIGELIPVYCIYNHIYHIVLQL